MGKSRTADKPRERNWEQGVQEGQIFFSCLKAKDIPVFVALFPPTLLSIPQDWLAGDRQNDCLACPVRIRMQTPQAHPMSRGFAPSTIKVRIPVLDSPGSRIQANGMQLSAPPAELPVNRGQQRRCAEECLPLFFSPARRLAPMERFVRLLGSLRILGWGGITLRGTFLNGFLVRVFSRIGLCVRWLEVPMDSNGLRKAA